VRINEILVEAWPRFGPTNRNTVEVIAAASGTLYGRHEYWLELFDPLLNTVPNGGAHEHIQTALQELTQRNQQIEAELAHLEGLFKQRPFGGKGRSGALTKCIPEETAGEP
jgi:hypothetical protein